MHIHLLQYLADFAGDMSVGIVGLVFFYNIDVVLLRLLCHCHIVDISIVFSCVSLLATGLMCVLVLVLVYLW
jgi:hypothetical protein